jgi:hypothetical protein
MRASLAPATIAAAVLAASTSGLFAEAPPLVRSSEQTQSSICLDFERDYADLAVLCETALTEFRHSDREMARILTNLGRSLVETDRLDEGHARLLEAAEIYPAWDRPWISIGWTEMRLTTLARPSSRRFFAKPQPRRWPAFRLQCGMPVMISGASWNWWISPC